MMKNELRTPQAARDLECSTDHLKRNRNIYGKPLETVKHYRLGRSSKSAILYDVEAIKETFQYHDERGRRAAKALAEV
tara:strand:+ start:183 stop:416 length:234 start_codon:yes stop_codon:yes gene_type:complete